MSVSIEVQRSRSWRAATAFLGGAPMLLYGGSFYTRDWKSVVPQAELSTERQATVRPNAALRPDRTTLAEPRPLIEPEATGALAGAAEPDARPSGSTTAARPSASTRMQAHAAPPRSPTHQKQKQHAVVATLTPAPVSPSRAPSAAPV